MSTSSVLLVSEHGPAAADDRFPISFELRYRFTREDRNDGFAAWIGQEGARAVTYDVAQDCAGFDGGFRLQALNRPLAQAIIRERPAVVVVVGLWGCTADLARIAQMLGTPCVLCIGAGQSLPAPGDVAAERWLRACLTQFTHVVGDLDAGSSVAALLNKYDVVCFSDADLPRLIEQQSATALPDQSFSYTTYEFALRDHPLLSAMQAADVDHFDSAEHVLDVACGAGIFMDALRRCGHRVSGVERDPQVARYARDMGLEVTEEDALAFLRRADEVYDGIYCSHFVEHVPIDVVTELLALLFARVRQGGVVVLVFPDPESIRSQLLGFWRDPEHVRFYHPELIAAMAMVAGFDVEWTSHQQQPHEVVPFTLAPPASPTVAALPAPPSEESSSQGWVERALGLVGLQSARQAQHDSARWLTWAEGISNTLGDQQAAINALLVRTETLWKVNQTWAWNDNATIRLRRPQRQDQ